MSGKNRPIQLIRLRKARHQGNSTTQNFLSWLGATCTTHTAKNVKHFEFYIGQIVLWGIAPFCPLMRSHAIRGRVRAVPSASSWNYMHPRALSLQTSAGNAFLHANRGALGTCAPPADAPIDLGQINLIKVFGAGMPDSNASDFNPRRYDNHRAWCHWLLERAALTFGWPCCSLKSPRRQEICLSGCAFFPPPPRLSSLERFAFAFDTANR